MDKSSDSETPTLITRADCNTPKYPGGVKVGMCLKERFVLEEEIGRGGMGIVFRALDLRKQETADKEPYVALKVISGTVKRLPESLIALQREAKKAQKLAHPNIATVYDFDKDGDEAFITMEILSGEPLDQMLGKHSAGLAPEQALPIIEGMARGLGYAHQQNIVHSDFKPGNVFICQQGAVKILDFGIARAIIHPKENEPSDHTVFDPGDWGAITPAYASYEMFYQAPPDPRDDIYALACVSYQLLSGHHPFKKLAANKAKSQGLKAKTLKGLNRRANNTLLRALAFERDERLDNVAEFLAGITPRRGNKTRWIAVSLASLIIAGASLFTWYKTSQIGLIETAIKQGDIWLAKPQAIDSETQARIDRLLDVAESHYSIGRLIKPATSNAAEAFMEILKLQPGNTRALAGIENIVSAISSDMNKLIENGKKNEAKLLLTRALTLMPGQKKLKKMQEKFRSSE